MVNLEGKQIFALNATMTSPSTFSMEKVFIIHFALIYYENDNHISEIQTVYLWVNGEQRGGGDEGTPRVKIHQTQRVGFRTTEHILKLTCWLLEKKKKKINHMYLKA